ncbi:MAG: TonB-dependent receptor [Burkholderiaceae bacterium]|nr:TonB-dependent receptor [Burkholderiaceae bacterium]
MTSTRRPYCLAILLALQAAAASAHAPADEEELSLLYGEAASVTIATGNALSLRRAPAIASVITAADIANMGASDLDQVLESIPGIHVMRSANSYAPLYVMRGVYSQFAPQVLVMQNGIPVTTLYTGNKGNVWGGFPVDHIARIEIIRGPGSALYGSDAFAGVINIITKSAADVAGAEFGVRGGTFRTREAWAQYGGVLGPLEVAAYLRVGATSGQDGLLAADAQTRNDALFGTRVSQAPGAVAAGYRAADLQLEAAYGRWRGRFGAKLRDALDAGAGIAQALDPVGQSRSDRITSSLAWTDPEFAANWGLGVSLSSQHYAQEIPQPFFLLPAGVRLPTGTFPQGMIGAPEFWERIVRASAHADYSGLPQHQIRIGIGHDDVHMYRVRERRNFSYTANGTPVPLPSLQDRSQIDPFIQPQRRRIDYLYLQDEWRLAADWNLTTGVRHDHYSDFGGTTNPRVALVWDAHFDLTAKLLYGRAFRAPSFTESHNVNNPVALGNPDLKPETNSTLEASLAWQVQADWQANLTLYRYAMANIIRTVANPVAGTGATYRNIGNQSGRGLELESTWTAHSALRLHGNYSWQRSIDDATGADAGYAPHHHVAGRADWQVASALMLSPQFNWVAGRKRAAGDNRTPIADYHTVDLALSTHHGKRRWNFTATVRNLFNRDVREPSLAPGLALPYDLPMAPRTLSLQASFKM